MINLVPLLKLQLLHQFLNLAASLVQTRIGPLKHKVLIKYWYLVDAINFSHHSGTQPRPVNSIDHGFDLLQLNSIRFLKTRVQDLSEISKLRVDNRNVALQVLDGACLILNCLLQFIV